jgi:hypothetical protein
MTLLPKETVGDLIDGIKKYYGKYYGKSITRKEALEIEIVSETLKSAENERSQKDKSILGHCCDCVFWMQIDPEKNDMELVNLNYNNKKQNEKI